MEPCVTLSMDETQVSVPASALDHPGFRAWVSSEDFPERVRASYIGGEVLLEMSPESIDTHNRVKLELTSVLHILVQEADLGQVYADRALLTNEQAQLSTEPDVLFATWDTLETGRLSRGMKIAGTEDAIELVGSPDLVVEIVSDTSVRKDRVALRARYARAKIAEYWLIDARVDPLSFEILLLSGDQYVPAAPMGAPQPSRLFKRTFALTRTRDRIGSWTHRLRIDP